MGRLKGPGHYPRCVRQGGVVLDRASFGFSFRSHEAQANGNRGCPFTPRPCTQMRLSMIGDLVTGGFAHDFMATVSASYGSRYPQMATLLPRL
jgi:hypothetical protein